MVVFVFGMPWAADLPSRQQIFVIDEDAAIVDGGIADLPFDIFPTERFKPSDWNLRPKIAWIDMQKIRAECINSVNGTTHVRTVDKQQIARFRMNAVVLNRSLRKRIRQHPHDNSVMCRQIPDNGRHYCVIRRLLNIPHQILRRQSQRLRSIIGYENLQ